jgi:mersacidin/lichenicidin family type 2 lantibiotic
MSNQDIIRAWKDENYRLSLSREEQELLPANPAGTIELSDELLDQVVGGLDDPSAVNSCHASCIASACLGCIVQSFAGLCG